MYEYRAVANIKLLNMVSSTNFDEVVVSVAICTLRYKLHTKNCCLHKVFSYFLNKNSYIRLITTNEYYCSCNKDCVRELLTYQLIC